jgi:DNA-binding CsgD family transcriptional regulator
MYRKLLQPLSAFDLYKSVKLTKRQSDIDYLQYFDSNIKNFVNQAVGPYYWFVTDNVHLKMLDCSSDINKFIPYTKAEWMEPQGAFERCSSLYHPDDRAFVYASLSFAMKYPQNNEVALAGKIRFNIYCRMLNTFGGYNMCLLQFPVQYFNENGENESSLVLTTDLSHLPMEPIALMTVIDNTQPEPRYFKMENTTKGLIEINLPKITTREQQVLKLITKGKTSLQIAAELQIAYDTVENHKRNLRLKTGTKNSAELMSYVYENKLFL